MPVTFPAQEVKRRGMSVMNESLAHGPVWVISNNTPKYVVMFADEFKRMRPEAFVEATQRSVEEYKAGNYLRGSASDLIADLKSGIDEED